MKKLIYSYEEIKPYINEGDVLLFRGTSIISKIIGAFSETNYSHVGVASWINGRANTKDGILEIVEFREMRGGRSVNLQIEVGKYSGQIDVYRPIIHFGKTVFNPITKKVKYTEKPFDGKAVTDTMRKLSGLDYSYKRIWWIFKHKLWIWKILGNRESLMKDDIEDLIWPVCSTSLAYAFNKNGFDLIRNRSDEYMEPGDIAKSPRLNYFFTLE